MEVSFSSSFLFPLIGSWGEALCLKMSAFGCIYRLHLSSWHLLGRSIRSNRNMHWGIRQKPKTDIVKKLKLTTNRGLARDDDMNAENLVDGWVDPSVDSTFCQTNTRSIIPNSTKHSRSKQLLQFDKSYRPAFYGFWPKKR